MENDIINPEEEIDMEFVANSTPETTIQQSLIIQGEIVTIDNEFAYVNVGTKSEGRVSLDEFNEVPNLGDKVEVMLVNKRLFDGMYLFSKAAADKEKKWQQFISIYNEGNDYTSGQIKESIKNGMLIDCNGVDAFLPFSLAADLKMKINQGETGPFDFKIKNVDRKKRGIVISRKDYLDEVKENLWKGFIEKYKVGDKVTGKAERFVEAGAIIDVDGVRCFIHKDNISWRKVFKKKKILKPDKEREFIIIDINEEKRDVNLGLKQLKEDPWLNIDERYHIDDTMQGKVVTLSNFGAFVEVEEGIEGLINASNISWTRKNVNPKNIFQKGQVVDVKILYINKEEKKLSLGIKQLFPNPWDTIEERFPIGSIHKNIIKKIVNYGLFVELEEEIDGMIHVSDISWDEDHKNPDELFKVNDEVEFKILEIDKEEMKISCGIKQLTKSPWEVIKEKYLPRTKVSGVVSGIVPFGLFIKLEDGVEGLVHISEVSTRRIENLEEHFKVGDSVEAIVLGVDVDKKRLSLSIKHYRAMSEKEELQKVLNDTSPSKVTLGDIFKKKLGE